MRPNLFQLICYMTQSDDKYEADSQYRIFLIGDRHSIWNTWFLLKRSGQKHLEILDMAGIKQEPEKGINGLCGIQA